MSHFARGFTLLEALIGTAVMGMLATLAYPAYTDQVQRSRRADAWDAMARVQLAQERHRSRHTEFAGTLGQLTLAARSAAQHYQVRVNAADAHGYVIEAAPSPDSPQARDPHCQRLRLVVERGVAHREAFDVDGRDSTRRCWLA